FSCSSGIFKTRITYDGTVGGGANFSLYCLPETSLIDHTLWDDESDELTNFAIAGSLDPDEDVLLPFITPRGAMAKYIGLKVY
ncbi:hypothetical protein LR010_03440, partial [Candidatus Gracilibacteria bacterium]|nr:hypothetical protein [Candidatus Gracilibacteria bacterium]